MKLSRGLLQAYDVQNFCHEALMALKASLSQSGTLTVTREDAQAIKAVVASWREAQERVAFHRHMPSPGVLRPEAKSRRKPKSSPILMPAPDADGQAQSGGGPSSP